MIAVGSFWKHLSWQDEWYQEGEAGLHSIFLVEACIYSPANNCKLSIERHDYLTAFSHPGSLSQYLDMLLCHLINLFAFSGWFRYPRVMRNGNLVSRGRQNWERKIWGWRNENGDNRSGRDIDIWKTFETEDTIRRSKVGIKIETNRCRSIARDL